MALLFFDGMDHTGAAPAAQKWGGTIGGDFTHLTTGGRYGGGAYQAGGGVDRGLSYALPERETLYAGFGYYRPTSTATNVTICSMANSGGTRIASLRHIYISNVGYIAISLGSALDPTSDLVSSISIADLTWYWIEWKVKFHDSDGEIHIYIDGVSRGSTTSLNTGTVKPTSISLRQLRASTGHASSSRFDDFYLGDTEDVGDGVTNVLGDCRIKTLLPNTTGFYNQFTGVSASPNYNCVNTIPAGDSPYIESNVFSQAESFFYTEVGEPVGTLYGINHCVYARKNNAGSRNLQPFLRRASTDINKSDSELYLGTSSRMFTTLYNKDPFTNDVWAPNAANTLEAGVRVLG
jgi:hypothetical protein